MITYTHSCYFDRGIPGPVTLVDFIRGQHLGIAHHNTDDAIIREALRWMYQTEASAAAYGTPLRFEFSIQMTRPASWTHEEPSPYVHIRAILFEGLTLHDREENGYDDSDFYAICWSPGLKSCVRVDYATTRFAGGGHCTIDAGPEVRHEAAGWLAEWYREHESARAERDSVEIKRGRFVRVVEAYKPRTADKIPARVGDYAYCFWEGPDRFSRGGLIRFGLEFVGGDRDGLRTFVTGSHKLEIVNPADYLRPASEIDAQAAHIAGQDRPMCYAPFTRLAYVV